MFLLKESNFSNFSKPSILLNMNPPLFCPLCYPKQNLRFFSKIPRFLNAFISAHQSRRRRHKYLHHHHVRRLVKSHHAVRRHEGAVQAQGIITIEYIVVIVCVLQSRRFIGFKRGTISIRFSRPVK